jgi:Carboxypeptidase regulatory-like domain
MLPAAPQDDCLVSGHAEATRTRGRSVATFSRTHALAEETVQPIRARTQKRRKVSGFRLVLACAVGAAMCFGQNAQVAGSILDPSMSPVAGAEVTVRNEQTGGRRVTTSNDSGFFSVFSLAPGFYRISVHANGFEAIVQDGIKLDVAENARLDFALRLGDSHTEVTVHGGQPLINTDDASVGTVINRDIIDQMPLNGRGIQSLIELTPGVVVTPVVDTSRGQFAVNGQRADANYYTVDGVSADFAAGDLRSVLSRGATPFSVGQAGGGMLPANNFLGTFSNLVSPDALQEFKIQTSTFSPEFGRSPGAQVGLVTRSGTNLYSGSVFEYFRNDKTDANDWFDNQQGLARPPLRFNDFGGSLGGPLRIPHFYNGRDRTFFFLSAEDLPTDLPQSPYSSQVPTSAARQNETPVVGSILDAYPLPNRSSNPDGSNPALTGLGQFVGSLPLQQDQQTYGIRLDHSFNDRLGSFLRYNRAPSERVVGFPSDSDNIPGGTGVPSNVETYTIGTQMLTLGLTHTLTSHLVNEIHLSGSMQSAMVRDSIGTIGGAKSPANSFLFPAGYSPSDSLVTILDSPLPAVLIGLQARDQSRQLQFVDALSWSKGAHLLKFGVDYRWFSPVEASPRSTTFVTISGLFAAQGPGNSPAPSVLSASNSDYRDAFIVGAFSTYAQDTWKVSKTLTLTYGLRWEVDPSPRLSAGQANVLGGLSNLSNVSAFYVLPQGKPIYPTSWSNLAPRLGFGWGIFETPVGKTVLRAGAGRFFDLGQAGFEDALVTPGATFGVQPIGPGGLGGLGSGPPTISSPLGGIGAAVGYNVPATYEWNVTLEQSIGQQSFSAGYIGAAGRRLTRYVALPDTTIYVFGSNGSSSYQAMQLQFNRRLSKGVSLLVSYTWSHSIDNLSSDIDGVDVTIKTLTQFYNPDLDRGSSDFDIRHSLNGSLIAPLPSPGRGLAGILFRNWSANSIFFARSPLPTDLLSSDGDRPNVIVGQPLYLYGAGYPGGKSYNSAAFSDAPEGVQGNFGRNILRGFGAWQVDFALHRTFRLSERTSLQLRAETFNIFNHPNFANPSDFGDPSHLTLAQTSGFGVPNQMLATGLSSTGVPGQLNPLFQIGGPRSMQFALRLGF